MQTINITSSILFPNRLILSDSQLANAAHRLCTIAEPVERTPFSSVTIGRVNAPGLIFCPGGTKRERRWRQKQEAEKTCPKCCVGLQWKYRRPNLRIRPLGPR
ncbi:hypothetical protein BaRGS_00025232, partial [Batillaria attramentaria]